MSSLAVQYRPQRFGDVVGQGTEIAVLTRMIEDGWQPPAIAYTGPFGCGKTTLARITAKAMLCAKRAGSDPCCSCDSCRAVDRDNNPAYTEVDAASNGNVDDVRQMKDLLSYKLPGSRRIIYYDESHMLSVSAQNALLKTLEEGIRGTTFMFATTEVAKMQSTVRSRSIELRLKLLTPSEITARVNEVASQEGMIIAEKAAKIIGTYARGHLRDAITLLEELARLGGPITEERTRLYLRLDHYDEIYQLLTIEDDKEQFELLEKLLCKYPPTTLCELIGETLVNARKVQLGINGFGATDEAWLKRVLARQGDDALAKADKILALPTDFSTIHHGLAAIGSVLMGGTSGPLAKPAPNLQVVGGTNVATQFRKPRS
jgi:DNA polymerase-3 subunit gamma/tau